MSRLVAADNGCGKGAVAHSDLEQIVVHTLASLV
jgi:hypothetical protein